MTRIAKYKKPKKPIGDDATPWEEMKKTPTNEEDRREKKRAEKKLKRQLKKVRTSSLIFLPMQKAE